MDEKTAELRAHLDRLVADPKIAIGAKFLAWELIDTAREVLRERDVEIARLQAELAARKANMADAVENAREARRSALEKRREYARAETAHWSGEDNEPLARTLSTDEVTRLRDALEYAYIALSQVEENMSIEGALPSTWVAVSRIWAQRGKRAIRAVDGVDLKDQDRSEQENA